MTYSLACGDVIAGCSAVFEAADEEDLLGQVAEHAGADHGITTIDDDVLALVKEAIRTR